MPPTNDATGTGRGDDQAMAGRFGDGTTLAPGLWADGVDRGADGVLRLHGLDVESIARETGTAVFVMDERHVRDRAAAFAASTRRAGELAGLPGFDAYYAGKAFLSIDLARWVTDAGMNLDVCTGGELAVALAAGVPGERIAFHGNNKSLDEIDRAVAVGIGRIVLDSDQEIDRVAQAARRHGVRQRVLLRTTVGIHAGTHEFIQTAHEDQKFGFSLAAGAAERAVVAVLGHPDLELRGLHVHLGSQILDPWLRAHDTAASVLLRFHAGVLRDHGVAMPELCLGGGFGIAYTSADEESTIAEVTGRLAEAVARRCTDLGIDPPALSIEPGRAIVGTSTFTLYRVGTVKPVRVDDPEIDGPNGGGGVRTYVAVDGGMSDNIRTALYGAEYSAVLANRRSDATAVRCRIVGKHCESGDIVVRDVDLPGDIAPGDLVAVAGTGAYCYTLASNYNHQPRPAVLAVADGGSDGPALRVLIRRETEEDLLRLDAGRRDM